MLRNPALLLLSFQLLSAAIDCRSPRTRQQRVVCANPELTNLDQRLSGIFESALTAASGTERQRLQYDQTSWEGISGGCWERVDCISKRYTDRIATLETLSVQASAASAIRPPPTVGDGAKSSDPTPHTPSPEAFQDSLNRLQLRNQARDEQDSRVEEAQKAGNDSVLDVPHPEEKKTAWTERRGEEQTTKQGREVLDARSSHQNHAIAAVQSGGPDGFLGLPIDSGLAIGMIVLVTLVVAAYCLPSIVAFARRHRNRWVILAINLAFGATLIGWIIALVWALNKMDAPVKGGIKYDPQLHDPIL